MIYPTHRIEIYEGPNKNGYYHIAEFWMADYHPGHPLGEHRVAERGQHFLTNSWEEPIGCLVVDKRFQNHGEKIVKAS
jgi:hypothetical protein